MSNTPKKPKKPAPKPANIPAWTCPKCGTAHPITVRSCCAPSPFSQPVNLPYEPWDSPQEWPHAFRRIVWSSPADYFKAYAIVGGRP